MQTHTNSIEDILESAELPFSILEEFAALSSKRKLLLCDHLFAEGRATFQQTVRLLWPEAKPRDMRELEKFLMARKRRAS